MAECRITVQASRRREAHYDIQRVEVGAYGARFSDRAEDVPAGQVRHIVEQMTRQPSKAFVKLLGDEGYDDIKVRLPAGFDAAEQRATRAGPPSESRAATRA